MKIPVNLFNLLPLIVNAVQVAESMKGATGTEKKAKAIELVRAGLEGFETVTGKHPLDIPEAADAVDNGIDAVVHAANAVKKAQQKEE